MIAEGCQAPLKADIVLLSVLILHKLFILLVDGIVGQVHVAIILVEFGGVALASKAREAFFVNINSEWFIGRDDHVDAQIEFVPVDKQRIGHIATDN